MSQHHFTAADFERHYIRYKAEGFPRGESMEGYCFRHRIPFNLFDKWYRDTRHKIVPVTVTGVPTQDQAEADTDAEQTPELKATAPEAQTFIREDDCPRIMIEIKTTTGLHLRQRNLSYQGLKALVEKLEGIC